MSDPVKQEEYYRLKEREEQEEKELIEKEEEAKFYRDIEAGLPFSEEVANRLGMLEYTKRYTSNHIDKKRLRELRENGKLKAIIRT